MPTTKWAGLCRLFFYWPASKFNKSQVKSLLRNCYKSINFSRLTAQASQKSSMYTVYKPGQLDKRSASWELDKLQLQTSWKLSGISASLTVRPAGYKRAGQLED